MFNHTKVINVHQSTPPPPAVVKGPICPNLIVLIYLLSNDKSDKPGQIECTKYN
jgi:hypothetical protein